MGIFGKRGRKLSRDKPPHVPLRVKPARSNLPISNTVRGFIARLCGRCERDWSEERRQTFLYAREMREVEKNYEASQLDYVEYTSARILLLLRYPESRQAVLAKREYDHQCDLVSDRKEYEKQAGRTYLPYIHTQDEWEEHLEIMYLRHSSTPEEWEKRWIDLRQTPSRPLAEWREMWARARSIRHRNAKAHYKMLYYLYLMSDETSGSPMRGCVRSGCLGAETSEGAV